VPTYEYQCNACKAVYELRQGFDAATTHKCEECGKGTAKRVLHAPPVVFKGGGWYATDSRNTKTAVSDSEPAESAATEPKAEKKEAKKADSSPSSAPAEAAGA
jgi:putative FmdB family regulatory protein